MEDTRETKSTQPHRGRSVPAPVTGVDTAIPVFIGYTQKRSNKNGLPSAETINSILICRPQKIVSVEAYEQYFGKAPAEKVTLSLRDAPVAGGGDIERGGVEIDYSVPPMHKMFYHIQMYFANGGGPCYVVSVGDLSAPAIEVEHLLAGLEMAKRCDDATLLLCPQIEQMDVDRAAGFYQAALNQASQSGDRFAIFDCFDNNDALAVREVVGLRNLSYGAVYHPYLKTSLPVVFDRSSVEVKYFVNGSAAPHRIPFENLSDELKAVCETGMAEATVVLPPSSAIAGMYVCNDATKKVWSAPADAVLSKVRAPSVAIDARGQARHIADNLTGKSINVIRDIPGKGAVVIGARTLAGNDRDWKYISMRRLFIMIGASVRKSVAVFKAAPNSGKTWVEIQLLIENFLMSLWYQGVLQGADPDRAYFVKIGLGETMTDDDIHAGRMIIDIGLAPVIPSEFMTIRIVQQMDGR